MKVGFTAEAETDLERIADHIPRDNPERALSFLRELREACAGLADFPHRFPLLAGYAELGIRYRVRGNCLIFYRAEAERVTVVHVLDGAMDYAAIVFPEDR